MGKTAQGGKAWRAGPPRPLVALVLGGQIQQAVLASTFRCGQIESCILKMSLISEFFKSFLNRGERPQVYFWRDSKGHEVDVILDLSSRLVPVEIKSARTVATDFFAGLNYWRTLSGNAEAPAILLHGGDRLARQHNTLVLPWWAL